jgi:hypothetical protein
MHLLGARDVPFHRVKHPVQSGIPNTIYMALGRRAALLGARQGASHGKGQASELQFVRKYSQKIVRVMSRSSPERSGNVVGIGLSCHHSQPQCVVTAL